MLWIQPSSHCRPLRQTHIVSHGTRFRRRRCPSTSRHTKIGSILFRWDGQSLSADASESEPQSQSPVHQPDSATAAASQALWKGTIPSGYIEVRPIEEPDQGAAMVVLTRAFAGTPDSPAYKSVMSYVEGFATKPAEVLLAAYLKPDDPAHLPPNKLRRVVGVAAVNFKPEGKDTIGFSQPVPEHSGYVSSMAVDKSFRRQGVAKALLKGAEAVAREAGLQHLYLTALAQDEAALKLYQNAGYEILERQRAGAIAFLNVRRTVLKVLICKSIVSPDHQTS